MQRMHGSDALHRTRHPGSGHSKNEACGTTSQEFRELPSSSSCHKGRDDRKVEQERVQSNNYCTRKSKWTHSARPSMLARERARRRQDSALVRKIRHRPRSASIAQHMRKSTNARKSMVSSDTRAFLLVRSPKKNSIEFFEQQEESGFPSHSARNQGRNTHVSAEELYRPEEAVETRSASMEELEWRSETPIETESMIGTLPPGAPEASAVGATQQEPGSDTSTRSRDRDATRIDEQTSADGDAAHLHSSHSLSSATSSLVLSDLEQYEGNYSIDILRKSNELGSEILQIERLGRRPRSAVTSAGRGGRATDSTAKHVAPNTLAAAESLTPLTFMQQTKQILISGWDEAVYYVADERFPNRLDGNRQSYQQEGRSGRKAINDSHQSHRQSKHGPRQRFRRSRSRHGKQFAQVQGEQYPGKESQDGAAMAGETAPADATSEGLSATSRAIPENADRELRAETIPSQHGQRTGDSINSRSQISSEFACTGSPMGEGRDKGVDERLSIAKQHIEAHGDADFVAYALARLGVGNERMAQRATPMDITGTKVAFPQSSSHSVVRSIDTLGLRKAGSCKENSSASEEQSPTTKARSAANADETSAEVSRMPSKIENESLSARNARQALLRESQRNLEVEAYGYNARLALSSLVQASQMRPPLQKGRTGTDARRQLATTANRSRGSIPRVPAERTKRVQASNHIEYNANRSSSYAAEVIRVAQKQSRGDRSHTAFGEGARSTSARSNSTSRCGPQALSTSSESPGNGLDSCIIRHDSSDLTLETTRSGHSSRPRDSAITEDGSVVGLPAHEFLSTKPYLGGAPQGLPVRTNRPHSTHTGQTIEHDTNTMKRRLPCSISARGISYDSAMNVRSGPVAKPSSTAARDSRPRPNTAPPASATHQSRSRIETLDTQIHALSFQEQDKRMSSEHANQVRENAMYPLSNGETTIRADMGARCTMPVPESRKGGPRPTPAAQSKNEMRHASARVRIVPELNLSIDNHHNAEDDRAVMLSGRLSVASRSAGFLSNAPEPDAVAVRSSSRQSRQLRHGTPRRPRTAYATTAYRDKSGNVSKASRSHTVLCGDSAVDLSLGPREQNRNKATSGVGTASTGDRGRATRARPRTAPLPGASRNGTLAHEDIREAPVALPSYAYVGGADVRAEQAAASYLRWAAERTTRAQAPSLLRLYTKSGIRSVNEILSQYE